MQENYINLGRNITLGVGMRPVPKWVPLSRSYCRFWYLSQRECNYLPLHASTYISSSSTIRCWCLWTTQTPIWEVDWRYDGWKQSHRQDWFLISLSNCTQKLLLQRTSMMALQGQGLNHWMKGRFLQRSLFNLVLFSTLRRLHKWQ